MVGPRKALVFGSDFRGQVADWVAVLAGCGQKVKWTGGRGARRLLGMALGAAAPADGRASSRGVRHYDTL